jgi:hypothetical protein
MTVGEAGSREGTLREVAHEAGLDTDAPIIDFLERLGKINSDLTVGADLSLCNPLRANDGLSSRGMSLHGAGFIVTPQEAEHLGRGRRPGLEQHIREYRNGRDLTSRARGVMVIDLYGLDGEEVRRRFPEVYQHIATTVRPQREAQFLETRTKDAESYACEWWLFGKPRQELRPAMERLPRYIATVETTKHRVFQFLDASILPDNMLVVVPSDDAFILGVLSSRAHVAWTQAQGGTLEDRPRYTKSKCFDPFPFPTTVDLQKQRIRAIAEDLDAHRKRVLADHPHLTLTGLYNVLEKLRAGIAPDELTPDDRRIFDDGLVLILKELHDRLDAAVAAAYGWPAGLSDNDILARLVALNQERVREEAAGNIRWLRPNYQVPRFGTARDKLALTGGAMHAPAAVATAGPKPSFPASELEQTAAVLSLLTSVAEPATATALAARFRQGRRVLPQVEAVLAALVRVGGLVHSPDGGRSFLPRRVA